MVKYSMANLQHYQAKICFTVAAVLIHGGQALLVKHKKLNTWLNPGGHIEANELPHLAAEREFFEETGIKVKSIDSQKYQDLDTEFLPNPIATNLHWVSRKNYEARIADPANYQLESPWQRGCEQHLNFLYVVVPVAGVDFQQNHEETLGIKWFDLAKLAEADLWPNIQKDLEIAQEFYKNYVK